MVTIRPKTNITMRMEGAGETHSRTVLSVRDLQSTIDEPLERDGTNLGFSPTETLMASLIGCTNVITQKIAHGMGVEVSSMDTKLRAKFNRLGVLLQEEVDRPFDDIILDIDIKTNATPEQMEAIKAELAKFCPIAKVIRGNGATITENWNVLPH